MEVSFKVIWDMLGYIFSIPRTELPYHIAMIAVCFGIAYCASLVLIGFPCSIWEAITKKAVNTDKQDNVIKVVSIVLSVLLIFGFLYEKVR